MTRFGVTSPGGERTFLALSVIRFAALSDSRRTLSCGISFHTMLFILLMECHVAHRVTRKVGSYYDRASVPAG